MHAGPATVTPISLRVAVGRVVERVNELLASGRRWTPEALAAAETLEAVKDDVIAWQSRVIALLEQLRDEDPTTQRMLGTALAAVNAELVDALAVEAARRSTP